MRENKIVVFVFFGGGRKGWERVEAVDQSGCVFSFLFFWVGGGGQAGKGLKQLTCFFSVFFLEGGGKARKGLKQLTTVVVVCCCVFVGGGEPFLNA